ncbi:toxin-antitoxin system YwqK family antitoxin [Muriicola soli]|uniref:MORN repeat protein n=1 Tax=Muriicola soli TaxID=2507538 RepID=A0A411E8N9_9FLAO|nr:hypothetical protein [Muriicola soli]QBA64042.1 hypothetical protein EQY75_05515 [Muriicola soli]
MNLYKLYFGILLLFLQTGFAQVPLQEIVFDEMGQQSVDGVFTYEGEPYTGKAIVNHKNGLIKTLREFEDGKYQGVWKEWYPNGGLKFIRNYEEGKSTGHWITYKQNGEIEDEGDSKHLFYRPFFGDKDSIDGYEETSPSFTADGKTMVLARYKEWERKVPFIAQQKDGHWHKEQLPFVDTLYNLAINPSGNRIIYKVYDRLNGKEISRVFTVDKISNQWGAPTEVRSLYNLNAGYFHITPDNTLYFFARSPKTGIFVAKPRRKNKYSRPKWLGDEVSLPDSDSFDVLVHPDKNKLIVSQYYDESKYPERGKVGLYYYEKEANAWMRKKRLPLGYGWAPTITTDGKFVFVRKGGIQFLPLEELEIDW